MADELITSSTSSGEGYPMNSGDGESSYSNQSSKHRESADRSKEKVVAAIVENLPSPIDSSTPFRIADLGCSVGPNTFIAVNNIIETVAAAAQQKYLQSAAGDDLPEFQVYFSDVVSNDFNYLFANLPRGGRQYFAAGVPGSFHERLFPKASLNFVYSAYAVQWLSKLPQELVDVNSPAYNKGRILYAYSANEVVEAYSAQFAKDMQSFLGARAQELAPHGLMQLLLPGRPHGTLPRQHSLAPLFEPLESSLLELVSEGLLSQEKLDSFNLPMYCPSVDELEKLVQENGCFDILILETQPQRPIVLRTSQECRAGSESILRKHLGSEIVEPLFQRYSTKLAGRSPIIPQDHGLHVGLLVLLKRKIAG